MPSMKPNKERRKIDGDWVKALRKGLNLSQEAFADLIGGSRSAVARWELNTARPTKMASNVLLKLAAEVQEKNGSVDKTKRP